MQPEISQQIARYLETVYPPEAYPCLRHQASEWRRTRPLKGLKILDTAPLFRNSLTKYVALLSAGADLTVGVYDLISWDRKIGKMLTEWGIPIIENDFTGGNFDIILDCAGMHAGKPASVGYSELTRSGAVYYKNCPRPVFMADDSYTKLIEDTLGTGEGFIRGMNKLGYNNFQGKKFVVFGCGKVGRGICIRLHKQGADVLAVDDPALHPRPYPFPMEDYRNTDTVARAISEAWCVITVTGKKHALAGLYAPEIFTESSAILANMGVENEYGPGVPPERVLNGNVPLNFILEEPTHLKYIDATLALHNEGAVWLLTHDCPPGIFPAPRELDLALIERSRREGIIADDLVLLEELGLLDESI